MTTAAIIAVNTVRISPDKAYQPGEYLDLENFSDEELARLKDLEAVREATEEEQAVAALIQSSKADSLDIEADPDAEADGSKGGAKSKTAAEKKADAAAAEQAESDKAAAEQAPADGKPNPFE